MLRSGEGDELRGLFLLPSCVGLVAVLESPSEADPELPGDGALDLDLFLLWWVFFFFLCFALCERFLRCIGNRDLSELPMFVVTLNNISNTHTHTHAYTLSLSLSSFSFFTLFAEVPEKGNKHCVLQHICGFVSHNIMTCLSYTLSPPYLHYLLYSNLLQLLHYTQIL